MPLEFRANGVALIGSCGAEEALELADGLATIAHPSVDLQACTHLHAALLQTLLAYKPAISAVPDDEFLAKWVLPVLRERASSP